jgi:hypothetical protein
MGQAKLIALPPTKVFMQAGLTLLTSAAVPG